MELNKRDRRLALPILFSLAGAASVLLATGSGRAGEPATAVGNGKALYDKHCAVCHGEKGDGQGPVALLLQPRPRDFTRGVFKVRSTPSGQPPTDEDLFRTVTNGMPGSAMPAFSWLPEADRRALVGYVKQVARVTQPPSTVIQLGTAPPATPEVLAKGKQVYELMECGKCHGATGRGDGPSAAELKDDWGQPIFPAPFTMGIYKGGGEPSDIYLRFTTGMSGTPMPSYADAVTDEEGWALVHYVKSLAGPAVAKQSSTGEIRARRISGDIPSDPNDGTWEQASAAVIPQMLLWRTLDAPWREVEVKALHNSRDIAFRVEWKDPTRDAATRLATNAFRDGVALQFPLNGETAPPLFLMGHGDGKEPGGVVNIWFWKADLQELLDEGAPAQMRMTGPVQKLSEEHTLADAATGWEGVMAGGGAGVFGARLLPKSPVESLNAGGFGTLTLREAQAQTVAGRGRWQNGAWAVVFRRSLEGGDGEVNFQEGKRTPFAMATWDGAHREGNGKKAVTTWYYVTLEGE